MANADPKQLKQEGEELKALFAKVKKKQHNCAVLMSKDGIVVEAHIKKSPEILVKAAKKKGGMAKGVWGTMTMEGQVIHIDPINDKIPGNLTKLAKKFFTARGMKLRMEILEPEEGPTSEEPAAEETGENVTAPTDEGGGEAPEAGDQKEALEAELADMQGEIDTLQADTENVMYSALQDALAAHSRAMDAEDFERGAGTLNTIKVVLEDYEGLMAQKRPLTARKEALAPAAERVKAGDNSEAADQIGRLMREFDYSLANNEWIGAGEKLDAIEQLIADHAGTHEDQEEEEEVQMSSGADVPSDESLNEDEDEGEEDLSRSEIDELNKRFEDLTPKIRDAATLEDPTLKKKLAVLVKGFKTEIKNDNSAKCKKILDLMDTLIDEALPESGSETATEAEMDDARDKVAQIDTEIGDIEAEMDAIEAALANEMETTI